MHGEAALLFAEVHRHLLVIWEVVGRWMADESRVSIVAKFTSIATSMGYMLVRKIAHRSSNHGAQDSIFGEKAI